MIEVSWGTVVGLFTVLGLFGPTVYHLGKLSEKVHRNTNDIHSIFAKLDRIDKYVRNGCEK